MIELGQTRVLLRADVERTAKRRRGIRRQRGQIEAHRAGHADVGLLGAEERLKLNPAHLDARTGLVESEDAGEKLVLEFEHKRLWQAGKKDLANRIEHVADTTGDHLGYDISSFETDGRNRLIEVKTTKFGELTPFFASKNEVEVSEARENEYQLYRLFSFTRQPKLFVLPGSLRASCLLEPIQYSASPR